MLATLLIACLVSPASSAALHPMVEAGAKSLELAPPAHAAAELISQTEAAPASGPETAALAPLAREAAADRVTAAASSPADEPVEGRALFDHATAPIFDTHLHWHNFHGRASSYEPIRSVFKKLAAGGIRKALLSSTPNGNTLRLYKRAPELFVPAVSPYRRQNDYAERWFERPGVPAFVEDLLRKNEAPYRAIGEFHVYYGEHAKTPVVRRLIELAAEHGLFLHVHTDSLGIRNIFAQDPDAKVLWAHAGGHNPAEDPSPRTLRRMLERYPNLYLDLSARELMEDGKFLPGWRALLRRHSDRIMLGTDPWMSLAWSKFQMIVDEQRSWLAALPPDVAENLAFRTAEKLFGEGTTRLPSRRLPSDEERKP